MSGRKGSIPSGLPEPLTARELEVANLLAAGNKLRVEIDGGAIRVMRRKRVKLVEAFVPGA